MAEPRKKILFLITKGKPGGAQRYVFDLATSVPVNEFNPVVAFGEGGELGEELERRGIRTVRIDGLRRDIGLFRDLKAFSALLRLVKDERPDVLHLNSSKIGFLGAIAGRVARVPKIVFTAHGWFFNEDRGAVSRAVFKALHWLTVVLSHRTIAVSKKTAADMDLPLARGRMAVIYNGIPKTELEQKSKVRNLVAPTIHEAVWIGTISELHRNKGIDFAIEAFANLADKYAHIAFVVIGGSGTDDGSGERKSLAELAERLGVADKVHFLGNIPDAGLLIKAFDIFTLTSRTEALPYVLLEAGRAELAVVASRVGGIPEIVTDRQNGLLANPGDVEEITKALEYMIEHPQKRKAFGERLRRTIERKFSVDRMVAETVKVYRGRS